MAVVNVRAELETMGAQVKRRKQNDAPVKTDNGMAILDCRFPLGIENKREVEREINMMPGVLENGLFLGLADEVLVGTPEGVKRLEPGKDITAL
jgi:ribose 5-phosphate isomerase A